jgi:Phosphatidylethanolamine-binding protein
MIARRGNFTTMRFRQSGLSGRSSVLLMLAFPCLCLGLGRKPPSNETQSGDSPMSIELTSTAFQPGATIPKQYTGDGADQSPPLRWSEPPSGTKSVALICDDPDALRGTWVHWVLFNLPGQTRELE